MVTISLKCIQIAVLEEAISTSQNECSSLHVMIIKHFTVNSLDMENLALLCLNRWNRKRKKCKQSLMQFV